MYIRDSYFNLPADDQFVWRYMDFTKFISLLASSCLYFTRADKFEDTFEGSFPRRNIDARADLQTDQLQLLHLSQIFQSMRTQIGINCWHLNQFESAAMWKLYLKSNEGITIKSTIGRLKQAIVDPKAVRIGTVDYIDYDTDGIDGGNLFAPFLHKRKSFEHEKEVRLIVQEVHFIDEPGSPNHGAVDVSYPSIDHGLNISIDLNHLIEAVYVSPDSPIWLFELIKSSIEKFGYDFEVIQSRMNGAPLF